MLYKNFPLFFFIFPQVASRSGFLPFFNQTPLLKAASLLLFLPWSMKTRTRYFVIWETQINMQVKGVFADFVILLLHLLIAFSCISKLQSSPFYFAPVPNWPLHGCPSTSQNFGYSNCFPEGGWGRDFARAGQSQHYSGSHLFKPFQNILVSSSA